MPYFLILIYEFETSNELIHPNNSVIPNSNRVPSYISIGLHCFGHNYTNIKKIILTFIRRSRNASKPASVHIAFISAPENSSLVITNSSKLTSSANVILDV